MSEYKRAATHKNIGSIKSITNLINSINRGEALEPVDEVTANPDLKYRPLTHSLQFAQYSTKDAREWANRVKKQKNEVIWASRFSSQIEHEFETLAAKLQNVEDEGVELQKTLNRLSRRVEQKRRMLGGLHNSRSGLKHELNTLRLHRTNMIKDEALVEKQAQYYRQAICGLQEKHDQEYKRLEVTRGSKKGSRLNRQFMMLHRLLLEMQTDIKKRTAEADMTKLNVLRISAQQGWVHHQEEDTVGRIRAPRLMYRQGTDKWFEARKRLAIPGPSTQPGSAASDTAGSRRQEGSEQSDEESEEESEQESEEESEEENEEESGEESEEESDDAGGEEAEAS
ncbi:MAG: hypothetical protein KVP17_004936 [Porospora cf. gigantea B]|uniref:uncharacterized protein n=1 Tax=Porospora cf. gigantea B TaxID=2853592 RepID=UPI003571A6C3|nr:MAG: hypothetical protein KVP17_004936 [Porospora cf. gigantea B]